jgi:hypothetical protein
MKWKPLVLAIESCTCKKEGSKYVVRGQDGRLLAAAVDNSNAWKKARLALNNRQEHDG